MPWAGGVYTRGYPSWSNDAANNLPISASKFDTEDNDFATGLNNCLTKDGLNGPSGPITWSATAAIPLSLTRGSDGTIFSAGRILGSNNPTLHVDNADGSNLITLNSTGALTALASAGALTLETLTAQPINFLTNATARGLIAGDGHGYLGVSVTNNLSWDANGAFTIAAPSSGAALSVNGVSGALPLDIKGVTSSSYLRMSRSGTANGYVGSADSIVSGGATTDFGMCAASSGALVFGVNGSTNAGSISTAGAWTIPAPSSGYALSVTGAASNYAMKIAGDSHSGTSFGLRIDAGFTASDTALYIDNYANTQVFLEILGEGEMFMAVPPAASAPPTNAFQVGYMELPQHNITSSTTLVVTDRGKSIYITGTTAAQTLTLPSSTLPVGAAVVVINNSNQSWTISSAGTLEWLPSGNTGSRTLAAAGVATVYQATATAWFIWGQGIT